MKVYKIRLSKIASTVTTRSREDAVEIVELFNRLVRYRITAYPYFVYKIPQRFVSEGVIIRKDLGVNNYIKSVSSEFGGTACKSCYLINLANALSDLYLCEEVTDKNPIEEADRILNKIEEFKILPNHLPGGLYNITGRARTTEAVLPEDLNDYKTM